MALAGLTGGADHDGVTGAQRTVLLLGCALSVALVVLASLTWSAWSLVVLPVPAVLGLAAWRGITPAQVWRHLGDEADPGAGPAGWWP